jgi:hypothetical protein
MRRSSEPTVTEALDASLFAHDSAIAADYTITAIVRNSDRVDLTKLLDDLAPLGSDEDFTAAVKGDLLLLVLFPRLVNRGGAHIARLDAILRAAGCSSAHLGRDDLIAQVRAAQTHGQESFSV